jgi:hypothetical protein
MTVWIVLGVGLFWALLCGLTLHEKGRVRRELSAYELACRRFAAAIRDVQVQMGEALLPALHRVTAAMREWLGTLAPP